MCPWVANLQPSAIGRVDDKDEGLRRGEVVSPERAQLLLPADVPHGEGDVLVLERLDVEADGRHCANRGEQGLERAGE